MPPEPSASLSRLSASDLKPGDEIEMYIIASNDGWQWEPATVLSTEPLRVRWRDGGERAWPREHAQIPRTRRRPEAGPQRSNLPAADPRLILKYEIDPATGCQHAIPKGSRFLSLQVQGEQPVMWWSVPSDPGFPNTWPLRTFTVVPTGPPGYLADRLIYVGTFQVGGFVGHLHAWEPIDV